MVEILWIFNLVKLSTYCTMTIIVAGTSHLEVGMSCMWLLCTRWGMFSFN